MEDFTLITEIKNLPLINSLVLWLWQEGIGLTFLSDRRDIMAEIKQELDGRLHPNT